MNEELVKALTSLIDETIVEIEDLKKSKFSASEVKIKGPGEDGLKGHEANGKLDKDEDKKDDDDDKKDDKDVEKGQNNEADPNGGHHQPVAKADDDKKDKKDDKKKDDKDDDKDEKKNPFMDKGENNSADPNGGHHQPVAKGEPKEGYEIKKSLEQHDALIKSYIDGRITTLEGKLGGILDLVKKIADQPVAAKGASAKNFAVLSKSDDSKTTLSKSQVADKLFELKKSGKQVVDSADITAAELGSTDLNSIITKYGLQ